MKDILKIGHICFVSIIVFLLGSSLAYSDVPAAHNLAEAVPTTFNECIHTDGKHDLYREESELRCGYSVVEKAYTDKYRDCLKAGGEKLTFITDSLDPHGSKTENICELIFYNPHFIFPQNFQECENEKKGAIIGGDGSTDNNGVLRRKTCLVSIDLPRANNKEETSSLLKQCIALGGDYNEAASECLIKFNEP